LTGPFAAHILAIFEKCALQAPAGGAFRFGGQGWQMEGDRDHEQRLTRLEVSAEYERRALSELEGRVEHLEDRPQITEFVQKFGPLPKIVLAVIVTLVLFLLTGDPRTAAKLGLGLGMP
jgi:hypothetical protein